MTIEQAAYMNKLEQVVLFAEVTERFTGQSVQLTDKARWLLAFKKDPEKATLLLEQEYNRVLSQFVEMFPQREYLKGNDGINGKDGTSGKDGKDGLDAPSMEDIRAEMLKVISELPKPRDGKDGNNAIIDAESLQEAILAASVHMGTPDVTTAITADPEAVRNALELLIGDNRLAHTAVQGVQELIDEVEKLKFTTQRVVGGGVSRNTVEKLISTATEGIGGDSVPTFEKINKNLDTYPFTVTYNDDNIDYITYTTDGGLITKAFYYTGDNVTSVTLTGDLPGSLTETTKSISYSGNNVSGVVYS